MFCTMNRRCRDPIHPLAGLHPLLLGREMDDLLAPTLLLLDQLSPYTTQTPSASKTDVKKKEEAEAEKNKKNNDFQVKINVQHFKPEELSVKLVDNSLIVEGKHEEKQDDQGFISRHFVRRYAIPENVKMEELLCNLGSDGVLQITAPRMMIEPPKEENVRNVPINMTGSSGEQKPEGNKGEEDKEKKEGSDVPEALAA